MNVSEWIYSKYRKITVIDLVFGKKAAVVKPVIIIVILIDFVIYFTTKSQYHKWISLGIFIVASIAFIILTSIKFVNKYKNETSIGCDSEIYRNGFNIIVKLTFDLVQEKGLKSKEGIEYLIKTYDKKRKFKNIKIFSILAFIAGLIVSNITSILFKGNQDDFNRLKGYYLALVSPQFIIYVLAIICFIILIKIDEQFVIEIKDIFFGGGYSRLVCILEEYILPVVIAEDDKLLFNDYNVNNKGNKMHIYEKLKKLSIAKLILKIKKIIRIDKKYIGPLILACISLGITAIYRIFINDRKNIVINSLPLITMIVMLSTIGHTLLNDKSKFSKYIGISIFIFLTPFLFLLQLIIIMKVNASNIYFSLGNFLVFTIISILLLVRTVHENILFGKIIKLIFGIIVYICILVDGCFLFFIYFASNGYISVVVIKEFNNTSGMIEITELVLKQVIPYYFNVPQIGNNVPRSFYILYFIGKFADAYLIGYILTKVLEIGKGEKNKSDEDKGCINEINNENFQR